MLKQLRKRTEGFTIIEVMIVLAIAGLILLIVFLAVPALQRNSRNTQAKNDASAILGAAQEYSNNNGGINPPDANPDTVVKALAKTKNITTLRVATKGTDAVVPAPADLTQAMLIKKARCGQAQVTITLPAATVADVASAPGDGVVDGTSDRQWVLIYAIENSAGNIVGQCQES